MRKVKLDLEILEQQEVITRTRQVLGLKNTTGDGSNSEQ
jgi:hypothetical protein